MKSKGWKNRLEIKILYFGTYLNFAAEEKCGEMVEGISNITSCILATYNI